MRRWLRLSALGAAVLAACAEPPSAPQQAQQQSQQAAFTAAHPAYEGLIFSPGSHVHVLPTRSAYTEILGGLAYARGDGGAGDAKPGGGGRTGGTGISYHGGPVVLTPTIAAIYWYNGTLYAGGPAAGTHGAGSGDGSLVGLFMRSLGGTGYWNINNTYYNGSGQHVPNSLGYSQYWADGNAPASGANVSDAAVQAEVVAGFTAGALTFDPNTLYAVFSGPGVNLGGGFGTSYCAYHGHFSWNGNDVKYAVMPYNITYPSACTAGSGISPTSDYAAAAEVNTLAHETEETMTDEDLNAWYDRRGNENADKCAWNFGTTSSGSTGTYNQTIGGVHWLIQMNWLDANSGGCVQHWP